MVKKYSIQFSGKILTHLDVPIWFEQSNVKLIGTSLSENIIFIQCDELDLASFLKKLNFVNLK